MQFAFTEEQNLIRETARGFLAERAGSARLRRDCALDEAYDPVLWQAIVRELGWAGIALPESLGGSGLGMVELAILLEEQGRCLYGGPFLASAGFASALLLEAPAAEARDSILGKLAAGELIAAAAVTGDSGLAGDAAVRVELLDSAAGSVLRGHAAFVLNGHVADVFAVVAHDRRAGRSGLALVTVSATAKGLTRRRLDAMDLTRPYARLEFIDVSPDAVLAAGGAPAVERGLQVAQVALAAEQLGSMQALLEMTTAYAGQRVQFGRVIGSFQTIKHRLADMMVVCEAARSAVYYAACVVDEYRADPENGLQELAEAAALVKVQCSAGFHDVAGNAIQLHGGIGFTWEYDAHLFFKRARASSNLLGSPQHHRERIAQLIGLDVPAEAP
jgi:alkylation response protein AidB-like acyl-CoA dehydrogenase